jgi:hypothetical protein
LAAELVADLEAHLAECAECHAAVEARRNILAQRLFRGEAFAAQAPIESRPEGPIEPRAAVQMVAEPRRRAGWLQSWGEVLFRAGSGTVTGGSTRKWRPLALSLLLSGLLIAMTAMAKNPNSLFGERVANPAPIGEQSPAGSSPDVGPMPMAAPSSSATEGSPTTSIANPDQPTPSGRSPSSAAATANHEPVTPETRAAVPREAEAGSGDRPTLATGTRSKEVDAPHSTTRPSSSPSPARNTVRPRPGARPDVGSIRVYDSEGNPIRP